MARIRNLKSSSRTEFRIISNNEEIGNTVVWGENDFVNFFGIFKATSTNNNFLVQYRNLDGIPVLFENDWTSYQRISAIDFGVKSSNDRTISDNYEILKEDVFGIGYGRLWRDFPRTIISNLTIGGEVSKEILITASFDGLTHTGGKTSKDIVLCRVGLFLDDIKIADSKVSLCSICSPSHTSINTITQPILPGNHLIRVKYQCQNGGSRSLFGIKKSSALRLSAFVISPQKSIIPQTQKLTDSNHVTAILRRRSSAPSNNTGNLSWGAYSTQSISVLPGERYTTTIEGIVASTPEIPGYSNSQLNVVVGVIDLSSQWSVTGDSLPVHGTFGIKEASVTYLVPKNVYKLTPFVTYVRGGMGNENDAVWLYNAPSTVQLSTKIQISDPSYDGGVFASLGNSYVEHSYSSELTTLGLELNQYWTTPTSFSTPTTDVLNKMCLIQGIVQGSVFDLTVKESSKTIVQSIPRSCFPLKRVVATSAVGSISTGQLTDKISSLRIDVTPEGTVIMDEKETDTIWSVLSAVRFVPFPTNRIKINLNSPWKSYDEFGFQGVYVESLMNGYCVVGGLVHDDSKSIKTDSEIIGYLPSQCLPLSQLSFVVQADLNVLVRVDIKPNGQIIYATPRQHNHNRGWISLTGIVFPSAPRRTHSQLVNLNPVWSSVSGVFGDVNAEITSSICSLSGVVEISINSLGLKPENRIIAELPSTCRPNKRLIFSVATHDSSMIATIDILTDGTISLLSSPALSSSSSSSSSFSNLRLSLASVLFAVKTPSVLFSPELKVKCINTKTFPIGVGLKSISVEKNQEYRFTVRGRVSNPNVSAFLWVFDETTAKNIVWPGPSLDLSSKDISVSFNVSSTCNKITIGVLFKKVNIGDEFVLESLSELAKIEKIPQIKQNSTNSTNSTLLDENFLIGVESNSIVSNNKNNNEKSEVILESSSTDSGRSEYWGYNYAGGKWMAIGGVEFNNNNDISLPLVAHLPLPQELNKKLVEKKKTKSSNFNILENVCDGTLGSPLGIASNLIPDWDLLASSESSNCRARFGRLNTQYQQGLTYSQPNGGWSPDIINGPSFSNEYFQINLLKLTNITSIDTQGASGLCIGDRPSWTSSYYLSSSTDGIIWDNYVSSNGDKVVFIGNSDHFKIQTNIINPHITGKYIRIFPISWKGDSPSLRVELHGCSVEESKNNLNLNLNLNSEDVNDENDNKLITNCPNDCSRNGVCVNNVCKCDSNEFGLFQGEDCSISPQNLQFVDVSNVIPNNAVRMSSGMAVVDIDGDGKFELFVSGVNEKNLLLQWNGGMFKNIATPELEDKNSPSRGAVGVDIDSDGKEEIFVVNSKIFGGVGSNKVYDRLFKYNGTFWNNLLSKNPISQRTVSGRSANVIDRFGTGKYSILVVNYNAPLSLIELNDKKELIDSSRSAGLSSRAGSSRSIICAPLVSSDKQDIFIGNENGGNMLFENTGKGQFIEIGNSVKITDNLHNARGAAIVQDYKEKIINFDLLKMGIVVGNEDGKSRFYVYSNDTLKSFVDYASSDMENIKNIRNVISADFDNDGYDELFFNNMGSPNVLLTYRDNEWISVPLGAAIESDSHGISSVVGDFNNDGILELFIAHGEIAPHPISVYSLPPNSNYFIRILPLTLYGAPARGARVYLQQKNRSQIKIIDSGNGYLSQQEPVAHFGLGGDSNIVQVKIVWPDGKQKVLQTSDLKVNKLIRVPYPTL